MGIRPIVSTINSPNLAEFLDYYLQPIMKQLAYLKDTTQFLCEIANIKVQADTWIVTIDVKITIHQHTERRRHPSLL